MRCPSMSSFLAGSLLASVALAGCALDSADTDDGQATEEEAPPDGGKSDSLHAPTDHGAIAFATPVTGRLTTAERFSAWTFELSGDAQVELVTSDAVAGQAHTDTVLYLYKESASGWGAYLVRNDNGSANHYSKIARALGAGRYRALVKGHLTSTVGGFHLGASCTGAGCAAPPSCLFGATYGDLRTNAALTNPFSQIINAATLSTYSAEQQRELVLAVQQSAHTDVTTPEQALGVVDGMEVNLNLFYEPAGLRAFFAFEYGAGDNSYGAIFERVSGTLVTAIHDGDLAGCIVRREQCVFPSTYNLLQTDGHFTRSANRVITAASQLSATENAQAVIAFGRVYGTGTTVASGLDRADGHQLNVRTYHHVATNRDVTAIELGAGDTSVGALFVGTTTQLAGVIEDLDISGCTLFQPR